MGFDSNSAWREATQLASANREVLAVLGGVFFLLPGLASVIFFSDFQAELMANLSSPAAAERVLDEVAGPMIGFGLLSLVMQAVGYLAMLALLTDRARPTVGQALRLAVRALPTVLGAVLLFFAGYFAAILVFALLAGGMAKLGLGALAVAFLIALVVGVVYAMVKFSLVLPVVMIEQVSNPIAALRRSWRLTKGTSMRLFLFFLLLSIAYFVILMVVTMVTMALAIALLGQGKIAMLIGGIGSGAVGAGASVMLIAVLAAIHRQLAGPSAEALGGTFD